MHKWAKQIMECVKAKVDGIGIDNFEGQNLDDLKDFTEIVKNIVEFDKEYLIVEAMENSKDDYRRYTEPPYYHMPVTIVLFVVVGTTINVKIKTARNQSWHDVIV